MAPLSAAAAWFVAGPAAAYILGCIERNSFVKVVIVNFTNHEAIIIHTRGSITDDIIRIAQHFPFILDKYGGPYSIILVQRRTEIVFEVTQAMVLKGFVQNSLVKHYLNPFQNSNLMIY